jgi:site-specific recombinase XerD
MLDLTSGMQNYAPDSEYNVKVFFMNNVLRDMEEFLSSGELSHLNNVLQKVLANYSISSDGELYEDIPYVELNKRLLTKFIEDKRLFGLSEKTLTYYEEELTRFFEWVKNGADSITTEDIRFYFEWLVETRKVSSTTVDNTRRIFNTFYNYCVVNGLLYSNPCKRIDKIKGQKKIKKPFSNMEIITMRDNFKDIREEAIFELLLSSGMRVGELILLNKKDLNWEECTVIVTGKGNKQRECFFSELAKYKIQKYLETREDDSEALFVALNKTGNRLKISGVERSLRELGYRAGVNQAHPHRFRRTFATRLLHKGVPIDQIQKFLGHAQIETTQLYASSNDEEIQYNHKRYVN